MNFNPYQNYGAGIAALGPVQSMSDRNAAQTLMANSGQMFASGGIARLASGGALPKYKYDPVSQTYVLADDSGSKTAMEETLLQQKQAARSAGSGYDAPDAKGVTPQQAAVFDFMNTERGASYKDAFGRANSDLFASMIPGVGLMMGVNPVTAFRDAGNAYSEAERAARADRIGNLPSGYEGVGGPTTYSPTQQQPANPSDFGGQTDTDSGGFTDVGGLGAAAAADAEAGGYMANGGLAALARGGMSHLGDYSDGGRLLRGPGDGVSDSIPAMIGNKRPARLADGEFVVPARIVSELGNGSTEAGARKLYAMMDRIQKGRKKSIGKDRVAVNSRADKNLPA